MDSQQFNQQYEGMVVQPLIQIGFQRHGKCLSVIKDQTVLALLRFQMKGSALVRQTHFLLCIRHLFLRTLEKEPANEFLSKANEYPFKLPVSKLSKDILRTWHYEPINLGPREYDTIHFGDLSDAGGILENMRDRIVHSGLGWMEYLTPAEALRQVKRYGEDAYCERIWIEDYQRFLNYSA
jgi:hypothetical protein